jgi:two-component system NarL family sensor kinase
MPCSTGAFLLVPGKRDKTEANDCIALQTIRLNSCLYIAPIPQIEEPMKPAFPAIILWLACLQQLSAQDYLNRYELLDQLPNMEQDTNLVLLYISIGQQYENNLPDSAIYYYTKAYDLSEKLGYRTGILKYYSNITYVYNGQGKYEEALNLNLQSVELAEEYGTPIQLAACLGNVANSYLYLERYEDAIEYFLRASEVISNTGNSQYQCILFNNLAIIYLKLDQAEKAREYAQKALDIANKIDNVYNIGISLDNLALTYIELQQPDLSLPYLEQALEVANKSENLFLKESILIHFAEANQQLGQFEKILPYAEEGLQLAKDLEDISGEATAYLKLGYYYLYRNRMNKAFEYAYLSENAAASINLQEQLANAYLLQGQISLANKDYIASQKYLFKHDSIEILTVNQRILNNIQELDAKYETEKKERQINQLEHETALQELRLRQNKLVLLILSGIIFTILTISFLLFRSYRQKQLILKQENELHERKIAEFETEKQLSIAEAMLKGQDEERTRLARDLHDGLGGMLTGIKLSFMNLRELMAPCLEDQQLFDRGLDMLDGSSMELRRVAHNLMPEVLLKFGLDSSINDLCENITQNGGLKVSYQSTGLDNFNPDQNVSVIIYRLVQELMNNILRHASAGQAFVQLDFHDSNLGITVEDNGIGFDTSLLLTSAGIGWRNIRNRVEYLTGKIDIQSVPERGTTVNIDLPMQTG